MQRVKTPTAVAEKPAYATDGAPGYFRHGDPVQSVPATVPGQDWFNQVQEELVNVILEAGIELDPADDSQLCQAVLELIGLHNVSPEAHPDIRALFAGFSSFPAGTKMLFVQAAAPTGWIKDTSVDNAALRVVSGGTGGNTGGNHAFTTVFGASASAEATTLTQAQMPAHGHDFRFYNQSASAGATGYVAQNNSAVEALKDTFGWTAALSVVSKGGGGSHTHALTMDLKYVDVIIATKQ